MDWDLSEELARCSEGALTYSARHRRVRFRLDAETAVELTIGEHELRNALQIALLGALSPVPVDVPSYETAIRLLVQRLRHDHAEHGDALLLLHRRVEDRHRPATGGTVRAEPRDGTDQPDTPRASSARS